MARFNITPTKEKLHELFNNSPDSPDKAVEKFL